MAKSSLRLKKSELKEFLDEKAALYESPKFIGTDPIQIPHQFSKKEDIEIIGFLVATIAWGNRKSIIKNGNQGTPCKRQTNNNFFKFSLFFFQLKKLVVPVSLCINEYSECFLKLLFLF